MCLCLCYYSASLLQIAKIKFECLLELIKSKKSTPDEMLSSQHGLHFKDICFVPPWHSLCMQQVSLHYLKCLIEHKAFQPEEFDKNLYSCSTAILLVFLSDDMLTTIKHVNIGLIVNCMGSKLFSQSGILPFINSIESDLKEARERKSARCGPIPALWPTMGASWPSQQNHLTVLCIPWHLMIMQWTKPTSTLQAVHQECTLRHTCVILYSISWIQIPPTDRSSRGTTC